MYGLMPPSPALPLYSFFFFQTWGILFLTCYIFIYISARFSPDDVREKKIKPEGRRWWARIGRYTPSFAILG